MGKIRRDYSDQERIDAVTLALSVGGPEASRRLGIPEGTIKRWLAQARGAKGEETGAEALKAMTEEVRARAVAEAAEQVTKHIEDRLKEMADDLYRIAQKAIAKIDVAISDPEELPKGKQPETHDRDGAAWVRSVVGVMAQGIEKAQLLSGKPTARNEERRRHEVDVTERLIADPEAVDLAEQLLLRAAGRDPGAPGLDDERGALDSLPAPDAPEPETG